MWRRLEQDGGTEHQACTSRQSNSLKQVEVETAFQELYSSLLGNKEKVQKSAPTDKHCAHTKPRADLYNLLALGNVPKSNLINAPRDVLKTGCSILSEHVLLRNSSSGPAITSINSTEAETSKPPTKRPNLKCTTFPGKAEENLKSDTECPFFARKQPILRAVGSSCKNNENGEDIFQLSDDDDISTNSGEDCRETVTCEACSEMFWKVINKKETKKKGCPSGKKQPYDPTSLSCDQWVLKKPLLPRSHQQKLRREISYLKNWIGTSALEVTRKWIPQCSRPHVFLQRNLRSCRRKVDEFLAEHSKKQPKKTRKRSRKKELFKKNLIGKSTSLEDNDQIKNVSTRLETLIPFLLR
ncbi:hypothetical protein scyTo_0019301 [Scyliorhinus torazame]|uniref:Uncharacterized protein n=1 Tax=Scyliorhinus torazame TaxID=75743 RepID=A0A401PWS3_SCYTO|nr:hypothetical protein [Scyliorhinus torazame]